jgi:hypothetical protein
MAGGKSQFFEGALLSVFRGTSLPFTGTDSAWVALFIGNPEGAGSEVSGTGYARFEIANGTGEWSAPSGTPRQIDNTNAVTFGPATGSWGTVDYVALFDDETAGNMLYSGQLNTPKAIGDADSAAFAAGALVISED